jgi:hypothetical protein
MEEYKGIRMKEKNVLLYFSILSAIRKAKEADWSASAWETSSCALLSGIWFLGRRRLDDFSEKRKSISGGAWRAHWAPRTATKIDGRDSADLACTDVLAAAAAGEERARRSHRKIKKNIYYCIIRSSRISHP